MPSTSRREQAPATSAGLSTATSSVFRAWPTAAHRRATALRSSTSVAVDDDPLARLRRRVQRYRCRSILPGRPEYDQRRGFDLSLGREQRLRQWGCMPLIIWNNARALQEVSARVPIVGVSPLEL